MRSAAHEVAKAIQSAMRVPASAHGVEIAGKTVRYRQWAGPAGATPALLVHGMTAHSHWWDVTAGLLRQERTVVAIDLSGMGESDHRESYSRVQHAEEIIALAEHLGQEKTILIAHSYGGDPSFRAATGRPDLFSHFMAMDTRLSVPGVVMSAHPRPERVQKVYASLEEALARFRLVPGSDLSDPRVLKHLALTSVREWPGGWSWKCDPKIVAGAIDHLILSPTPDDFAFTYVRGIESTVVTAEHVEIFRRHFPNMAFIELPAASHHMMVDQPLATAALIRGFCAGRARV